MSRKTRTGRSFEAENAKSNEEEKNEVSETKPKEKTAKPESATTLEGTSRTTFQIESIPENETTKKSSPKKDERTFLSPQKKETHPEIPKKPIYEPQKRSFQEKSSPIRTYRPEPSREVSREYPKSRENSPEYPRSRENTPEYPKSRENTPEFREPRQKRYRERSKEREKNYRRHQKQRSPEKETRRHRNGSPERHRRGHFEKSEDSRSDSEEYPRHKKPKKKTKKRSSYEATSDECMFDDKKVVFCVPCDDKKDKRRFCCFVEAEPKKRRSINPNLPSVSKNGFKRGPKNDELLDIFCKNDPFPLQDLCEQKRKTRRVPPGFSCPEDYSKSRRVDDKCDKEDEDKLFLLSMLPTLEKLNEPVKMDAKIQIMQIMQRYVYSKPKF